VPGISKSQVYDNFRKTMKAPRPTGRYIRTQLDARAAARFEGAEWSSPENKTIIPSSVTRHSL